jgi:hypothetical protein
MARKRKPPVVGNPNDHEGLYVWMQRYLEALRVRNYSERTVENRESYLGFVTGARNPPAGAAASLGNPLK